MSNESIGSLEGFKVPEHDGTVIGSTDDLFEVGIEGDTVDGFFVAFEAALEGWVGQLVFFEQFFDVGLFVGARDEGLHSHYFKFKLFKLQSFPPRGFGVLG